MRDLTMYSDSRRIPEYQEAKKKMHENLGNLEEFSKYSKLATNIEIEWILQKDQQDKERRKSK